jgi:hypothetical protein
VEAILEKISEVEKKVWSTPKLTVYGSVEQITAGQGVPKIGGSRDDLHTMSNPQSQG